MRQKSEARGGRGERGPELDSVARDALSEVVAEQRLKQHENISHAEEGTKQTEQSDAEGLRQGIVWHVPGRTSWCHYYDC